MRIPYEIMHKSPHLIAGYVISVKRNNGFNTIILRKDNAVKNSGYIYVQAWKDLNVDYQKMTDDIQGRFITGVVVPGNLTGEIESWKLRTLIISPEQKAG